MTRSVVPFTARKGDFTIMRNKLFFSAMLLFPSPLLLAQESNTNNKNSWWDTPISAADPQPIAETPLLDDPAPSPFDEQSKFPQAEVDATGILQPAPSPFGPQPVVPPSPGQPIQAKVQVAPSWNPAGNTSTPGNNLVGTKPVTNMQGAQNYMLGGDSGIWLPYGPSRTSHTLQYMQCMNCPPCVWEGYAAQRQAELARFCQFPQANCRTGHCHNRYLHPHCGQGCNVGNAASSGGCSTGNCGNAQPAPQSSDCNACAIVPIPEQSDSGVLAPIPASQASDSVAPPSEQPGLVAQQPNSQFVVPQYR